MPPFQEIGGQLLKWNNVANFLYLPKVTFWFPRAHSITLLSSRLNLFCTLLAPNVPKATWGCQLPVADSNKGHTGHSLSLFLCPMAGSKTWPGESFLLQSTFGQCSCRPTSLSFSPSLLWILNLSMAKSWQVVLDLILIWDVATLRGRGRYLEMFL